MPNLFTEISPIFEFIITFSAVIGILIPIFKWSSNINSNMKKVLHEITPNHGTSIKDKVNAIDNAMKDYSDKIVYLCAVQELVLSFSQRMIFKCDSKGNWTWVNDQIQKGLNVNKDFLLNAGWRNYIISDNRDLILEDFDRSMNDNKNITIVCTFERYDTENPQMDVILTCKRISDNEYLGWISELK